MNSYESVAAKLDMLDSIQQWTFLFFLNEHHANWGIVKDRTTGWGPASIAATAFLAAFPANVSVSSTTSGAWGQSLRVR